MRDDLQFVRGYLITKGLNAGPILHNMHDYYFFVQKKGLEGRTATISLHEKAKIKISIPPEEKTEIDLHEPDSLIKIYLLVSKH